MSNTDREKELLAAALRERMQPDVSVEISFINAVTPSADSAYSVAHVQVPEELAWKVLSLGFKDEAVGRPGIVVCHASQSIVSVAAVCGDYLLSVVIVLREGDAEALKVGVIIESIESMFLEIDETADDGSTKVVGRRQIKSEEVEEIRRMFYAIQAAPVLPEEPEEYE